MPGHTLGLFPQQQPLLRLSPGTIRQFSSTNASDDNDPGKKKPKDETLEKLKQFYYEFKNDSKEFYYKNPKRTYGLIAATVGVLAFIYFRHHFYPEMSFYELIKNIENGSVESIEMEEFYEAHSFQPGYCFVVISNKTYRTLILNRDMLMRSLENSKNTIKIMTTTKLTVKESWRYFTKLIWIALFAYILQRVLRAKKGSPLFSGRMNDIQNFKKSRAKEFTKEMNIGKRFKDVAGMEEAKLEIAEFVEFLKSPDRFKAMGAKLPKGALLAGPPGTGKTLLGKACAGEANVPFFFVSGSEFMEMFVGVGASRVRDLFKQAKEHSPSIIFIDEIDAIGRKRSNSMVSNSEADSTLNQLLVEMDGFGTDSNVVVFAATNRKELLDSALTRPGRLDRIIEVTLPDLEARMQIFKVHLTSLNLGQFDESSFRKFATKITGASEKTKESALNDRAGVANIDPDVQTSVSKETEQSSQQKQEQSNVDQLTDREKIIELHAKRLAALTPGFSGADIANICNEAAIQAVRSGDTFVQTKHFELAVERVIGGLPRKSIVTQRDRETVAVHESGHGVISWFLKGASPLLKLTIIPRTKGSLGYAQYLPNEMSLETEEELTDRIIAILAGRCAEEEFFGRVTTGAYDDLQKAFRTAHAIVTKLGMSKKIGLRSLEQNEYGIKPYSEETNKDIDEECKRIIDECTAKCRSMVKQYRKQIQDLSTVLLEKETIDLKMITSVLGERPFPPREGFKAYLENA
jgi:AFG3 family protein